jgi:hypothetical protein
LAQQFSPGAVGVTDYRCKANPFTKEVEGRKSLTHQFNRCLPACCQQERSRKKKVCQLLGMAVIYIKQQLCTNAPAKQIDATVLVPTPPFQALVGIVLRPRGRLTSGDSPNDTYDTVTKSSCSRNTKAFALDNNTSRRTITVCRGRRISQLWRF